MAWRAAAPVLSLILVCVACAACARTVELPRSATQTIRGVAVTVETTTGQAADTSYYTGISRLSPRSGYRFASVMGTATNSTDATVAVPNVPVTVSDASGAELQGLGGMRVIRPTPGGALNPSRIVGHRVVGPEGIGPGGTVFYVVSYELPNSSHGPVRVVWTMGDGRRYAFDLRSP